jgi:predicted AAA+ superfamily ATPase
MAHQFDVGGVPLSVGVTPKLQKSWIYNYTTSIYDYDKNQWNNSKYRKDDGL